MLLPTLMFIYHISQSLSGRILLKDQFGRTTQFLTVDRNTKIRELRSMVDESQKYQNHIGLKYDGKFLENHFNFMCEEMTSLYDLGIDTNAEDTPIIRMVPMIKFRVRYRAIFGVSQRIVFDVLMQKDQSLHELMDKIRQKLYACLGDHIEHVTTSIDSRPLRDLDVSSKLMDIGYSTRIQRAYDLDMVGRKESRHIFKKSF